MLSMLRRRSEQRKLSEQIAQAVVTRAREPVFYKRFGVADTIDGRFDMLVLHAWLVLDRLEAEGNRPLAQSLVDGFFVQFDEALRQQGAGDIGMTRRMTKMADAFYGRLGAYRAAADTESLAAAIQRNVFRGNAGRLEDAAALAIYAGQVRARLARANLSAGEVEFGAVPV